MVNNLEGYAEYAVQKKLKAKDRMPVVASAALMVVGLAIWTFIAGWVGPSILIIGIALTIITATRKWQEDGRINYGCGTSDHAVAVPDVIRCK